MKILPAKSTILGNSFNALNSALSGLQSQTSNMRQAIYAILAAILHLGNVCFSSNDEGFARINDDSKQSLQNAADLLRIDTHELNRIFLERTMSVAGNQIPYVFFKI